MFNFENEENPIFPFIQVNINNTHKKYSFNSTRINSIIRVFNGASANILFKLIKNIGSRVFEVNSGLFCSSNNSNIQNTLCFIDKDITTIKYCGLPEILLARNFFQFNENYIILCNCCYKEMYESKLYTFDLSFYIESQDLECFNKNKFGKVTLISRSSSSVSLNKFMNTPRSMFTDYGLIYIIYSFIIQLANIVMAFKRYFQKTLFCEFDIEKLFIDHFVSSLDIQIYKKVFDI